MVAERSIDTVLLTLAGWASKVLVLVLLTNLGSVEVAVVIEANVLTCETTCLEQSPTREFRTKAGN